jgi:apolipoprotein N-acyltransferase
MVTITNDAWFGMSAAPYQHFGMVVFRAVENRSAFARAANTGISGFIDPQGRILMSTPIFQEQAVNGRIPVGRVRTFYTQHGDVFAYACAIITGILLMASRKKKTIHQAGRR